MTDFEFHGWQESPMIREALREGRMPEEGFR
jgi:hypothetical protein